MLKAALYARYSSNMKVANTVSIYNGGRTPPLFLCRYYNVRFKVVLVYLYLLCSTERLSGVPNHFKQKI